MKFFKRNQIIIYVIALMIMTAGYLNYTTTTGKQAIETSMQMESKDDMQIADIGDATLVSSNDVVSESPVDVPADENATKNEKMTNDENARNDDSIANGNIDSTTNSNGEKKKNNSDEVLQTSSNTANKDEYFVKSKLERDTMYSQMIETYEKVLNSANSLEMQKQTATQEIQKINEIKNSIMISENLIKTKGFENNIIFVNSESVSVIIGVDELKQEEIAQIQNIISREMKAEIENIHIATK